MKVSSHKKTMAVKVIEEELKELSTELFSMRLVAKTQHMIFLGVGKERNYSRGKLRRVSGELLKLGKAWSRKEVEWLEWVGKL